MTVLLTKRGSFSEYTEMSKDLISKRVGKHPPHIIHSIRWSGFIVSMELRPLFNYLRDGIDDSPPPKEGKLTLEWKELRDWDFKWVDDR